MGSHNVSVSPSPTPTAPLTLNDIVSGDTATAGSDFTIPSSRTMQVSSGASSVNIPVSIVNDMVNENNETAVDAWDWHGLHAGTPQHPQHPEHH